MNNDFSLCIDTYDENAFVCRYKNNFTARIKKFNGMWTIWITEYHKQFETNTLAEALLKLEFMAGNES